MNNVPAIYLNRNLVKRKLFANNLCYKAALHAVDQCNLITERINLGYLVFKEGHLYRPYFGMEVGDDYLTIYEQLPESPNVRYVMVGTEWTKDNLIYCTKKELKNYFKDYKYIAQRNLKSF